METGRGRRRRRRSFPESIVVEIIARLPLRSIARFKTVCKEWRSLIESSYFRSLFVTLHRNASSSWSLMFDTPMTEVIGFHGCERWDLPKSPASYLIPFKPYYVRSFFQWIEVKLRKSEFKSLVGNPVSQEWVEIPPPPTPGNMPSSLVTRLVNGVVTSFKVVRTTHKCTGHIVRKYVWGVYVYSSETGTWTFNRPWSSFPLQVSEQGFLRRPLSLNGMLYMWEKRLDDPTGPGVLVAHDFYAQDDDECLFIPLPGPYNMYVRRCLTTSSGHVIYLQILYQRLKVWKLKSSSNSDGLWWQLIWEEIDMASAGFDIDCFPLGVNPFDTYLVYLWSQQHSCVVSGNLRTQEFTLRLQTETWSDAEGSWRVNTSDCKECMEDTLENGTASFTTLTQLVLPQWMDPVPRPPN